MKQRIRGLLSILLIILSICIPVFAAGFDAATAREGVIYIESNFYDTQGQWLTGARGTGFFVNETTIITNHHVIEPYLSFMEVLSSLSEDLKKTNQSRIHVGFDDATWEEAYIVAYDENNDLAILRLDKPTARRTPVQLEIPTEEMVGTTVYAIGYPGIVDQSDINPVEKYNITAATVTRGSVTRLLTTSGSGMSRIQIDAAISGGNSGGPLFTEHGSVIGVNSAGFSSVDNTNYAVNASALVRLLDMNGVSYTTYNKDHSSLLLIGCTAGVAILVVIIIVVVVAKKRNKNQQKQKNAASAQDISVKKSALIRSLSAQHNGLTMTVAAKPIIFGRDAVNCQIVYHKDTAGVSARHCQVTYDAEQRVFLLMDLNSTYGTFLVNDKKLSPGIPVKLQCGESFYLGEKANSVIVEEG